MAGERLQRAEVITPMFQKVTTLTEFLLREERNFKNATGSFTLLMTQIENAAKIIASHIKKTGLADILGQTGERNTYGEEVQKLDKFSNDLLVETLTDSGQVYALASEELEEPLYIKKYDGDYIVFFDPLDGSSNIDTNISIGTIFSIYHKNEKLLHPGYKQIAAGYIIYGSSVMFVYTAGNGVNGFTLDPAIGSFLLSHPDIKIPESGTIYSINEGYFDRYSSSLQNYLTHVKKSGYKLRYVGSMVADIHRTLLKGGIFLYPADSKNKEGKLRLMFEGNPMAYLVEQAGGKAISNKHNPLEIQPESVHHKIPVILGSKKNVEEYMSYVTD